MTPLLRRLLVLVIGSVLATGCVPDRPDGPPGVRGQSEMAVLTSSADGYGWDIQLLDMDGNFTALIDADLDNAVSLTPLGDGGFLVSDGSDIIRVEPDGSSGRFNLEPMPSVVYRMNITEDDEVTVAEEYDVTKLDDEGNLLEHTVVEDSSFCWMDAAAGTSASSGDALLDVFGPTLATWDEEGDSFDVLAPNFAPDASILGRDGMGNNYSSSSWSSDVHKVTTAGESSRLTSLEQQGIAAWGIHAIEPAGANSVFVLFESDTGSGIARVDASGNAEQILSSEDQIWLDLVVF